ncbi:MAG: hypothetical protein R3F14_09500 [Polyangiaceae bacterium]
MLAALGALGLVACPGTLEDKECFLQEQRVAVLFAESCTGTGCHNAQDKFSSLDLESPGLGGRLRGKVATCGELILDPGNPDGSLIYSKLSDGPLCGTRMPLGLPEWYEEDKELVRIWIAGMDGSCSGAGAGAGGTGTGGTGTGGTGGAGTGGAGTGGAGTGGMSAGGTGGM